MLQLRQQGGKVSLYRKSIFPTPEGSLANGRITDSSKIVELLRHSRQAGRWHGNRINLCLDSRVCYLRTVKMPEMSKRELGRALRLEAEKSFSIDIDRAVIASALINRRISNGSAVMKYMLAAVPKEISDLYTAVAVEAGFNPLSLDIAPLTMLRSFNHDLVLDRGNSCLARIILDCGYETNSLLIASGRDYLFHRSINKGINHFIRAMQAITSLNHLTAQQRIFSKESLSSKGLLDAAIKFSNAVAQTLEYCREENIFAENKLPGKMAVCGGGIFVPELAAKLQNILQVKLILYNPLRNLEVVSKKEVYNSNHEGALFTTAHGLALRGWSR